MSLTFLFGLLLFALPEMKLSLNFWQGSPVASYASTARQPSATQIRRYVVTSLLSWRCCDGKFSSWIYAH